MLNFEETTVLILLCIISHKLLQACKFYLISRIMITVNWKKTYSLFTSNLIFQLENSIKFVLLNFYLLCFASMAFSRFLYILALDFFFFGGGGGGGIYWIILTPQQPQNVSELQAAIRLELTNIPKIMFKELLLKRFRGAES